MKERPILFSAPMVRAILEGRKTQTRRVVKPQPQPFAGGVHPSNTAKHPAPYIDAYCGERKTEANPRGMGTYWCWWTEDDREGHGIGRCPFGQPGDRLWVRECWAKKAGFLPENDLFYRADGDVLGRQGSFNWIEREPRWLPSIHMPRWASRITLEVTGVRVERLQNISEADAAAEGVDFGNTTDPLTGEIDCDASEAFEALWESINGAGSWDANPWVWVVEFRRLP